MLNPYLVKKQENIQREKLKELSKDRYIIATAKSETDATDVFIYDTITGGRYIVETKSYNNPQYPRFSTKFKDYQIDWNKLYAVKEKAHKKGCKPLLMAFFTNELVVWDLDKSKWEDTKKIISTNKEGLNYGTKEKSPQAYLYFEDAIYRNKDINYLN